MFALGIVDKLTPGSLTGGKYIAGTGTIDDAGHVGADRRHPAEDGRCPTRAGATVFLAPAGQLRRGPRRPCRTGCGWSGSSTLSDAVEAARRTCARAGPTSVPTC